VARVLVLDRAGQQPLHHWNPLARPPGTRDRPRHLAARRTVAPTPGSPPARTAAETARRRDGERRLRGRFHL
jgi:hypothetical protein